MSHPPNQTVAEIAPAARGAGSAWAKLGALWVASVLAGIAPAVQAADASASGLIIRLKQAPAHSDLTREPQRARHESERWRDVMSAAALTGQAGRVEPLRRPVGRDQVLLDFGRPLPAHEAAALAERLRLRPEVDWVAPNVREQRQQVTSPTPSDPLFAQQWWLHTVGGSDANAPAERRRGVPGFMNAWASGIAGAEGGPDAVVAVLDTGITAHPELDGRLLPGRDMVRDDLFSADGEPGRDADPGDPGDWVDPSDLSQPQFSRCGATGSSWHGTAIAGLLVAASDNGLGVAGMLRQGRVLPVRVAGKCGATVADIIDGMRWAAGLEVDGHRNPNPARIISLSFGGTSDCGREYQDTIDELRRLGVVVVAAAGNEHGKVTRPASCAGVVGVAALNRDGFKTSYSNFGSELAASGIATVGGDDSQGGAWGTWLADGGLVTLRNAGTTKPGEADYAAVYGTSFATPLVAGTLALMLSVNPSLSAEQLIDGLRRSARPHVTSTLIAECSALNPGRCICTTATCGAGILDAEQALRYAADPATYVAPARQPERLDNRELVLAAGAGADRPSDALASAGEEASGGGEEATGGGALGAGWLALLAMAVVGLARGRRPTHTPRA